MKTAPSRDDAILAAYSTIFQVWRTDADPRFDLSFDPSEATGAARRSMSREDSMGDDRTETFGG